VTKEDDYELRIEKLSYRSWREDRAYRRDRKEILPDVNDGSQRSGSEESSTFGTTLPERRDSEWEVKIHQDNYPAIPGVRKTDRDD